MDGVARDWFNLSPKQVAGTIILALVVTGLGPYLFRLLAGAIVRLGLAGQGLRRWQRKGDLEEQLLFAKLERAPVAANLYIARVLAGIMVGMMLWIGGSLGVVWASLSLQVARGLTPAKSHSVGWVIIGGFGIIAIVGQVLISISLLSASRFQKYVDRKLARDSKEGNSRQ